MKNKQTAVQWFASKVMYLKINPKEMHDFLEWYEEAREMEKKQVINNYEAGLDNGFTEQDITGEQYYKEVYE